MNRFNYILFISIILKWLRYLMATRANYNKHSFRVELETEEISFFFKFKIPFSNEYNLWKYNFQVFVKLLKKTYGG